MKPILIILITGTLCFSGCTGKDEDPVPLPVPDPITAAQTQCSSNLSWLKDIIKKADEDKATMKYGGGYLGTIHLGTYNYTPVFLVQMFMCVPISYVSYCAFDCSGTKIIDNVGAQEGQKLFNQILVNAKLIYKNTP